MKTTLLKKLFIGSLSLLAGALVVTQGLAVSNLLNKISSNNDIINLEQPPVPDVVIDPSEIVTEGVVDNIFEAEYGLYEGSTGWAGELDHHCVSSSYLFNPNFSGSICLVNISKGNNSKNNSLSFTFNSSKAEVVNMEVAVTGLASDTLFKKVVKTTINDEPYNCDDVVLGMNNGQFVAQHYTTKFSHSITKVTVPIKLKEGENTIKFSTRLPGENTMFGFDYINVKTTAELSGFVSNFWNLQEEVNITFTTIPTANTAGVIRLQHDCGADNYYPIPSLGDGFANKIYSRIDNTSSNTFDYYLPNNEIGIKVGTVNKGPFKLTIDSPYVSINSGADSLSIIATEGIDESLITTTAPYGKKIVGWYNANNKNEYWMGSTYRMPERNVTIRPIFDGKTFVEANDQGTAENIRSGKVDFIPGSANYLRASACTGSYSTAVVNSSYKDTIIVLDNNEADTALQYNHASGMKAGDQLATMIPCNWATGTKRLQTVLQNQGTATLTFDFFIYRSGGSPELARSSALSLVGGAKAYVSLTLAPGQVEVLDWHMQNGHNNMMHGFYFTQDCSNFSLAMYQYIDARHTLSIGNGQKVTFEDGSATALVEPYQGAPKIVTNLEEGDVLTHFKQGDNTYKADLSDFVMGLSDVSLTPVIISNPVERTLTIEGIYATFADNTSTTKLYFGSSLPSGIKVTTPENMSHVGWVNVNSGEFYLTDSFIMPDSNTTIAPVFDYTDNSYFLDNKVYNTSGVAEDGTTYAQNARSGKAKIYDYGNPSTTNPIRVDQCNGFGITSASSVSEFMKSGAVKTAEGYYEKSAFFTYDGNVTSENYFTLFKTQQSFNISNKKVAKFSFTNYGSEDLSFTISFSSSSGNPSGSKQKTKDFTVKAGESIVVDWNVEKLQKDSLLLFFEFTSSTSNINLAMNLTFEIEGK